MLVAEIHGKYVAEARNFEDYLTSAVFGHLRYIKPGPFWDALFDIASSLPIGSLATTASQRIHREIGRSLGSFENLDAIFWPEHAEGIPDLVLHFSGDHSRSVVILIEAKLTATKSGTGEYDQLARYLRILDSLASLRPPLPQDALALAVYLTTTDSRTEIVESLEQYGDTKGAHERLLHLQWQDIITAIERTAPTSQLEHLILSDVRGFLRARDLEYFSGMESASTIPDVAQSEGEFLKLELCLM